MVFLVCLAFWTVNACLSSASDNDRPWCSASDATEQMWQPLKLNGLEDFPDI